MSNMTRLKVEVKDVNQRILGVALGLIADHYDLKLEVSDYVLDYFYREFQKCMYVLKGPGLDRGMGFNIVGDRLEIIGDADPHVQPLFREIQEQLKQYYIAAQHLLALKTMGCPVKVEKQKDKIVITAVR